MTTLFGPVLRTGSSVVTFGSLLLVPLFLLCMLPVWPVTPRNFQPTIKISGFDLLQAWKLRRTAAHEAAEGRFDEALGSWRIAIANNPGDPELLRGCLQHLLRAGDVQKYSSAAVGYTA